MIISFDRLKFERKLEAFIFSTGVSLLTSVTFPANRHSSFCSSPPVFLLLVSLSLMDSFAFFGYSGNDMMLIIMSLSTELADGLH